MAHVRIRCRLPQPTGSRSWSDSEVFIVEDDGTERAWLGVKSVEWSARAGDEPINAKIELFNVELDVMGCMAGQERRDRRPVGLDGDTVDTIVDSVARVYGKRVARAVEARLRAEHPVVRLVTK